MIPRTFGKEISKRHPRNHHTWLCENGEWRVRQFHWRFADRRDIM